MRLEPCDDCCWPVVPPGPAEGARRNDLLKRALGDALDAVDFDVAGLLRAFGIGGLLGRALGVRTGWTGFANSRRIARTGRRAERVAGGPDELVGLVARDRPLVGVVAVAESCAAGAVRLHGGRPFLRLAFAEADIIAPDRAPDALMVELIAQQPRLVRVGEGVLLGKAEIAKAAALRDQHDAARSAHREGDVAHRMAVARPRDVARRLEEIRQQEFAPYVAREIAIGCELHRPDRIALLVLRERTPGLVAVGRAAPDRIEQPDFAALGIARHPQAPHAAAGSRQVPAFRRTRERSARTVVDAGARRWIEGDRRETSRLFAFNIEEAGAALRAMVPDAEVGAVGGAQPVDHAGFQIGDEELLVPTVIGDVAEGGAGVRPVREANACKQRRAVAVRAIELVDGARAARAPHAGHPIRIVGRAMQAECGRGGDVDVGRVLAVQRNAENLADLGCLERLALRLVDPVMTLRRLAGRTHIDDASDRSLGVDRHLVALRAGCGRAGKAGHKGLARLHGLGPQRFNRQQQAGGKQCRKEIEAGRAQAKAVHRIPPANIIF